VKASVDRVGIRIVLNFNRVSCFAEHPERRVGVLNIFFIWAVHPEQNSKFENERGAER
jgi:hypothetical protein